VYVVDNKNLSVVHVCPHFLLERGRRLVDVQTQPAASWNSSSGHVVLQE